MQASGGEDADVVAIETTPSQIHVNSSSPRWYSNPNITDAQLLSQISCIMTGAAAIVGFALYESTASPAMLAFSLENLVDLASSAIILWRFFPPANIESQSEKEAVLQSREKKASVAVAAVIFLLGFQIFCVSMVRFKREDSYVEGVDFYGYFSLEILALYVAFPSAIGFGLLSVIKFKYADCFDSPALRKDGFCSLAGTVLSVSIILEYIVSDLNPDIWWLDPVIAFIVGLVMLGIGIRTLFLKNRELPICSISWWTSSPSVLNTNETSLGPPNGLIHNDLEMSTQDKLSPEAEII